MSKEPLTITDFARMGGIARAKKLSKKRRRQIAQKANRAAQRMGRLTGRPKNKEQQGK